jgi:hypothetical protein
MEIIDIEISNIDTNDYPDFVDAYIVSANVKEKEIIREATEEELDFLNEDSQLVYDLVQQYLY